VKDVPYDKAQLVVDVLNEQPQVLSWLVWVRRHETHPSSPPKLEFQARCRYCWGPDTWPNTGAMRFDIFKGPFTEDSAFIVSPFTSTFRYVKDVPYDKALAPVLTMASLGTSPRDSSLKSPKT
jgi:hypothetical protein